jgi:hypothetical protein
MCNCIIKITAGFPFFMEMPGAALELLSKTASLAVDGQT